ncbi:MAG: transglycosylase SLT domain-containing protein [Gammaproteobacteria bacterium]|jgi:membrane-bound lytic murein transglycosylase D
MHVNGLDTDTHKAHSLLKPLRLLPFLLLTGLAGCASLQTDSTAASQGPEKAVAQTAGDKTDPAPSTDAKAGSDADAKSNDADAKADPGTNAQQADSDNPPPFPQTALDDQPKTIWSAIRGGFELPDVSDEARVQAEIRWYADHPDYIERVTERAKPFLHYILQEVQERKLPTELVLLPIVESAYRPYAYSHSRAAGLWQFIPATGRRFGLEINWWYDGRRDIHASTNAALDYLSKLYNDLGHDWLLAIAAYNCGEGTVQRAIRYNKRHGRPTDFWHLRLPQETRHYVPKLLAVKHIISDPTPYKIALTDIPDEPVLKTVKLDSQIDMAIAARLADMDLDKLYRLNPGYNRWATAPNGPYYLLMPKQNAQTFETNLQDQPQRKLVLWERHRIRSGESLIAIARRYRTTVHQIKRVNHLHSNSIRAGHYLIVPKPTAEMTRYAIASPRLHRSVRGRGQRLVYTVKTGDSFWEIARYYKVSVHNLLRWNGMAPHDTLHPGMRLVVWKRVYTAQGTLGEDVASR